MEPNLVTQAIRKIESYLERTGMKESRLGLLACANPRAVERVRNKSASIETMEALLEYVEAAERRERRGKEKG
jgi:hypothetical protein